MELKRPAHAQGSERDSGLRDRLSLSATKAADEIMEGKLVMQKLTIPAVETLIFF